MANHPKTIEVLVSIVFELKNEFIYFFHRITL